MAASHIRSTSLPCDFHPLIIQIEDLVLKLKASGSLPLRNKLAGLRNLHDRFDDFLQLPLTRQALCRECQSEFVEDLLDGSLRLLDTCGITSEAFSQTKECIQTVESSLRRRKAGELGLTREVDAYVASRKSLNKVIHNCLRKLKKNKKTNTTESIDNNSNLMSVITILKGVEEICLEVFESTLLFISPIKPKSKSSCWSIVSKLLKPKPAASVGRADANEFEKIYMELLVLKSITGASSIQVQGILKGLGSLESIIHEIEEELECIYRSLVKSRVTLLNILHH